jgi:hypothetical protein
MEFYSAMKKNEILLFASKWMELKNIILGEVSQAQKTNNHMFSFICELLIKGKYSRVIGLWSHDKARAYKGGMRISKKLKFLFFFCSTGVELSTLPLLGRHSTIESLYQPS